MPYQNISSVLTPAEQTDILKYLNEASNLMPFVVNLAKGEKKKSLRMGNKTEKFLNDVQKLTDHNPQLVPGYVSTVEYDKDFALYLKLLPIEQKLRMMLEAVTDTRYALAQECQKPALAIYSNIQSAALNNVPGADSALNELKPYFKKERKKKKG